MLFGKEEYLMKKLFDEFKKFCAKGNILELATGVMIGGAFTTIVNSLVNDMLMPVIGLVTGGVNLSGLFVALDGQQYVSIDAAKEAGVGTLNYGAFIQNIINFLIIALIVFLLVKSLNKMKEAGANALKKEEEGEPEPEMDPPTCPFCLEEVKEGATRCPHCAGSFAEPAKPTPVEE